MYSLHSSYLSIHNKQSCAIVNNTVNLHYVTGNSYWIATVVMGHIYTWGAFTYAALSPFELNPGIFSYLVQIFCVGKNAAFTLG